MVSTSIFHSSTNIQSDNLEVMIKLGIHLQTSSDQNDFSFDHVYAQV